MYIMNGKRASNVCFVWEYE